MSASPDASPPATLPFVLRDAPAPVGPVTPAARPLIEKAIARLTPEPAGGVSSRSAIGSPSGNSTNSPSSMRAALCRGRHRRDRREASRAWGGALRADGRYPGGGRSGRTGRGCLSGAGRGRMLLARLVEAGVARGIVRFRGIVLPDNKPMLELCANTRRVWGSSVATGTSTSTFAWRRDPRRHRVGDFARYVGGLSIPRRCRPGPRCNRGSGAFGARARLRRSGRDREACEVRPNRGVVERLDPHAEMVEIAARSTRRRAACRAELAGKGHEVDQAAARAELDEPDLVLAPLDRAASASQ